MMTVKNAGQYRLEINNEREVVHTDVPAQHGGQGEYPTPVVLFAESIAACVLTMASLGGGKRGVDSTGWWAEVTEIGFDEGHTCVERVSIHLHLGKNVPEEQRAQLEAYALKGCTVGNSVKTEKQFTIDYDV